MKKEAERICVQAELIYKEDIPYDDLASGKGIPIKKDFYELLFRDENGKEISFSVSEYEFHVVQCCDKGELVYVEHKRYNELISFADKICEFDMKKEHASSSVGQKQ